MSKEKNETADPRTTTLRMRVTEDEHAVLYTYARKRLSMTVDDFLRMAVGEYLAKYEHKSIAEMAAAAKNRGKIIQGELFG